jgi:glutamyl-tRNA synthetase
LYARHHAGKFILRIEDTDRLRSTPENVEAILDGLDWLGLDTDEGPYFQSERGDRYKEVIEQWLTDGKAYHCYCTPDELAELRQRQMSTGERVQYDGRCRERVRPREGIEPVVRFKNPREGKVVVDDAVRGTVTFENQPLDDLIIARSDGAPTYNFTVVVDDSDMKISHVIRGDDHLNNTPRQINMLQALGVDAPKYAHLPMILGPDGAKLSKRHGAIDIREYREQGFLPEAMLNYLVRLGWAHGNQEIFSIDEMISLFDIGDVNQSASSFNPEKLLWINQQHIISASPERLAGLLMPYLVKAGLDPADGPDPVHVAQGFHERAQTLLQMASSARYCFEDFELADNKTVKKHLRPAIVEALIAVTNRLAEIEHWGQTAINEVIQGVASDYDISLGKLGQPLRVAVTGGTVSPPIDVTLWLVGKERTVQRLRHSIDLIKNRMPPSS